MKKSIKHLLVAMLFGLPLLNTGACAQNMEKQSAAPMTSADQAMDKLNTLPQNVTTEIIAVDEEGRARAQHIIELYELISTSPTIESVSEYVASDYVQHSPMLPDGPEGLAMFFATLVAQYPVKIDVHRIMVVGDWAVAHVNFRNLDTDDPNDLGSAGVDIYTFGPDGKLNEHWDAVQGVPSYSVNPHGMFLRVRSDN